MSLKDQISEDIKAAMKSKDKVRLETVRFIKKLLLEKEVSARATGQEVLTEEQEIEVLIQSAKMRRESIEQYGKAGREDLVAIEQEGLAIVEEYLPQQMSDEEIAAVVERVITATGAQTPKDMGKVMAQVIPEVKGKADGKKVQELVKAKLGG
jgi:uncharacterized protein YqeY